MKIITSSKENRRVTCQKCGCIYEYEDSDIVVLQDTFLSFLGLGASVRYVECPECGTPFNVRCDEQGNEYGMKACVEDAKDE